MPSEKILEQKKQVVEELSSKLKSAVSVVMVDYKGINVADDTALRTEMRAENVDYFVAKNSLLKYACERTGFDEFVPMLEGTTAIAVSADDAIAPARIVQKYSDKLRAIFNTKMGYIDGKFMQADEVRVIATLPPKDVLVAMVAGSLNSIVASFARAISEVAKKQEEVA